MIQAFVGRFMAKREKIRAEFAEKHPGAYEEIVRAVVAAVSDEDADYYTPDPGRVHVIDDGAHQGTLVFVIGAKGYQPDTYWYARIGYGSCSGCDTLQDIRGYGDESPTAEQAEQYTTLALHVVQRMKQMDGDEV